MHGDFLVTQRWSSAMLHGISFFCSNACCALKFENVQSRPIRRVIYILYIYEIVDVESLIQCVTLSPFYRVI